MRGHTYRGESEGGSDGNDTGPVPGKRSRTETLPAGASPAGVGGHAVASAAPDLSYEGLFGVDLAAGFGNTSDGATRRVDPAPAAAAASEPAALKAKTKMSELTADDFDVSVNWAVRQLPDVQTDQTFISCFGGSINTTGSATLKPHVSVDQSLIDVGFTQTVTGSERIAIYSTQADIDDAIEAQMERDEPTVGNRLHATEHQRRTLKLGPTFDRSKTPHADPPFFEDIYPLGASAQIIDEPGLAAPITSQDGAATVSALSGHDSFLTHLIAKPMGGKPIFLGWATWMANWVGDVSVANKTFTTPAPKGELLGSGAGKHGSPILGGSPANKHALQGTWSSPAGKKKSKKAK